MNQNCTKLFDILRLILERISSILYKLYNKLKLVQFLVQWTRNTKHCTVIVHIALNIARISIYSTGSSKLFRNCWIYRLQYCTISSNVDLFLNNCTIHF